jgi:hypothetical protein
MVGRRLVFLASAIVATSPALAVEIQGDAIEFNGGNLIIDGAQFRVEGGELVEVADDKSEAEAKPAEPDPAGEQTIELVDGSQIHGQLVSFGKTELVWQRADASTPIVFPPSEVRRIVLGKAVSAADSQADATLKLAGGDWLTGKLSTFSGGKFTLDAGADAPLEIDRSRVEWMYLSKNSPDAFEGPKGPAGFAGWEPGGAATWDYVDDSLVATQTSPITRNFAVMPERMDIQFTAGDGGNQNRGLTLWIQPEGRASGYGPGSVYLRFQSNTVSATSYDGAAIKTFTNTFKQDDARIDKTSHYRLLFDRKSGRIHVRVNGVNAADWQLPVPVKYARAGGALTFQPTYWTSETSWTLSNVKVLPWDGDSLPDGDPDHPGADILKAATTERRFGVLESIVPASVRFSGKEFPRTEPLFIRPARKPVDIQTGAVARVWLAQRGEFDVLGLGFKDGVLKARTSFAGDIALPVSAVRAVQFAHRQSAIAEDAATLSDTLIFKNGDQLKGKLVAAGSAERLRWKPVNGGSEVQFDASRIAGVQLKGGPLPGPGTSGAVTVRWQNGDWLPGDLVGLENGRLEIQSPKLGRVEIAREGLEALYFGNGEVSSTWDGSSEREKWMEGAVAPGFWNANRVSSKGAKKVAQWIYFDGAFTLAPTVKATNGEGPNIGRSFDALPDKCVVSFVMYSPGISPAFSAQFFFDDNKPGVMVQTSGDFAYLYDMSPRAAGRVVGNAQQQLEFGSAAGEPGKPRRYTFFCERSKGRFWMAVNGEFVGSLSRKGAQDSPKPGRSISIAPQMANGQSTISELWVGAWSGVLPPPVGTVPQDSIALVNGDGTSGIVTKADADSLFVQCDVGEIEIPAKRATIVQFAPSSERLKPGVRLRLVGAGCITVETFRFEKGAVIGTSPTIGEFRVPVEQVSEIVFAPEARSPFLRKGTSPRRLLNIQGLRQIMIR